MSVITIQQKEYLDSVLDNQEKDLIGSFMENEKMRESVKKIILAAVYMNGTLQKGKPANSLVNVAFNLASLRGDFSNETVGADLRALWKGVEYIEGGFKAMESYIREQLPTENKNSAR